MRLSPILLLGLFLATTPTVDVAALERPVAAGIAAGDAVLVPDRFLRSWDPVTVFFENEAGPKDGGAEDHPSRLVELHPAHPGAWTWLDARTLQFRPAEPWPPLQRFEWRLRGETATLTTLMSAPVQTLPAAGSTGLDPIQTVTLTFREPLDLDALRRMLRIELRPLPGIGEAESRWLDAKEFAVKPVERHRRNDPASYVVAFEHPVPLGTRARIHLRLSLDDDPAESFFVLDLTPPSRSSFSIWRRRSRFG